VGHRGEAADCPGGDAAQLEVTELRRREGINPTQHYDWKNQLLSAISNVL
jgi:hypothetical protein